MRDCNWSLLQWLWKTFYSFFLLVMQFLESLFFFLVRLQFQFMLTQAHFVSYFAKKKYCLWFHFFFYRSSRCCKNFKKNFSLRSAKSFSVRQSGKGSGLWKCDLEKKLSEEGTETKKLNYWKLILCEKTLKFQILNYFAQQKCTNYSKVPKQLLILKQSCAFKKERLINFRKTTKSHSLNSPK